MKLTVYNPEISVSSSRIVQESLKIEQGVSAYGAIAAFLDANLEQLDRLAEYCSQIAAQSAVKKMYDEQYFDPNRKVKSFMTRNIYLNEDKKNKMEGERFVKGVVTQAATEAGIKLASRSLLKWANDRDKYVTCEQVYAVMVSYIRNAESGANISRAEIELNKIRNSFPLNSREKRKLVTNINNGVYTLNDLNVSSILSPGNIQIKNALAYFLTVLNRQLYGNDIPAVNRMTNYYSLLDLNGVYGNEVMNENQYCYDEIAADQAAYLQLSRSMVKNLFIDLPSIDMEGIMVRASEMAKYDPYAIRRKKVKGASKGAALSITGIISNNPELAFNGLSTAVSQFLPDDETLTKAKDRMQSWGVSSNECDMIFTNARNIESKCTQNDLMLVDKSMN